MAATESGPCSARCVAVRPTRSSASSQVAGCSRPSRRTSGLVSLSPDRANAWANRPLTRACPRFWSIEGGCHRGHRVVAHVYVEAAADSAVAAGGAGDCLDRAWIMQTDSKRAPVGHASTQPPQATQGESIQRSPAPAPERCRRGRPASARTSPEPRRTSVRSGRRRCIDRDRSARTGGRSRPFRRSGRQAGKRLRPMRRRHGPARSARPASRARGPAATTPAVPASRAPPRSRSVIRAHHHALDCRCGARRDDLIVIDRH